MARLVCGCGQGARAVVARTTCCAGFTGRASVRLRLSASGVPLGGAQQLLQTRRQAGRCCGAVRLSRARAEAARGCIPEAGRWCEGRTLRLRTAGCRSAPPPCGQGPPRSAVCPPALQVHRQRRHARPSHAQPRRRGAGVNVCVPQPAVARQVVGRESSARRREWLRVWRPFPCRTAPVFLSPSHATRVVPFRWHVPTDAHPKAHTAHTHWAG